MVYWCEMDSLIHSYLLNNSQRLVYNDSIWRFQKKDYFKEPSDSIDSNLTIYSSDSVIGSKVFWNYP